MGTGTWQPPGFFPAFRFAASLRRRSAGTTAAGKPSASPARPQTAASLLAGFSARSRSTSPAAHHGHRPQIRNHSRLKARLLRRMRLSRPVPPLKSLIEQTRAVSRSLVRSISIVRCPSGSSCGIAVVSTMCTGVILGGGIAAVQEGRVLQMAPDQTSGWVRVGEPAEHLRGLATMLRWRSPHGWRPLHGNTQEAPPPSRRASPQRHHDGYSGRETHRAPWRRRSQAIAATRPTKLRLVGSGTTVNVMLLVL